MQVSTSNAAAGLYEKASNKHVHDALSMLNFREAIKQAYEPTLIKFTCPYGEIIETKVVTMTDGLILPFSSVEIISGSGTGVVIENERTVKITEGMYNLELAYVYSIEEITYDKGRGVNAGIVCDDSTMLKSLSLGITDRIAGSNSGPLCIGRANTGSSSNPYIFESDGESTLWLPQVKGSHNSVNKAAYLEDTTIAFQLGLFTSNSYYPTVHSFKAQGEVTMLIERVSI